MWWGGYGFFWLWPLGIIFFLFVLFGLSRIFFWRMGWGPGMRGRYGPGWGGYGPYRGYGYGSDPHEAESIVRQRLARGEIDQTEYERLLEILRR